MLNGKPLRSSGRGAAPAFGVDGGYSAAPMNWPRQNISVGLRREGVPLDAAEEDDVVAAVIARLVAAFEMRGAAIDHRRAVVRHDVRDIEEAVVMRAGEALGELDLIGRQDVDDEMRCLLEGGQALRIERLAPQHERRVERYRGERIDGEADRLAILASRGDDGDAGGEGAERVAEVARIEMRRRGLGMIGHRRVFGMRHRPAYRLGESAGRPSATRP